MEVISAGVVIFAIGQRPELECLQDAVEPAGGRFPRIDKETLATSRLGIFAGGDVVTGTAFVVDAIAAGHSCGGLDRRASKGRRARDGYRLKPSPVEIDVLEARAVVLAVGAASAAARAEPERREAKVRCQDFAEVYLGLTEEQAKAEAERCLGCGECSECLQCVYACRARAIVHNQVEQRRELSVGAVVLSPGLEPISAAIRPEYGYGRYPNVVTSLQFERMLSASGPFGGVVQRPSDGGHPHKVAWIQCVGSRDTTCGQGYCSSVCCMYATKEAVIAREHDAGIEPTIFYIDVRAFGKGFDEYIDRAAREQGVRYVRSMVSAVKEIPTSKSLRLSYATFTADGAPKPHEEEFDLVVLSVGLRPNVETQALARRLESHLMSSGLPRLRPLALARPRVRGCSWRARSPSRKTSPRRSSRRRVPPRGPRRRWRPPGTR